MLQVLDRPPVGEADKPVDLMTVNEAAALFRCSNKTVYRWISLGLIPDDAVIRTGSRSIRLVRRKINCLTATGITDVRR